MAIGVLARWPGPAITACTRLTQPSQMYARVPAISFSTCSLLLPQNVHDRTLSGPGTHSLYPGGPATEDQPRAGWLQASADFTQSKLHVSGGEEAISAAGSARLDEKLGKLGADVSASRSWVDHRLAGLGH